MGLQDLSDILTNDEVKEVTIEHEGKDYNFKIRDLPWSKVNSILSRCISYEGKKKVVIDKSEFDIAYLSAALVEAPWPKEQTRMFLTRLSPKFGKKLEALIPNPVGEEDDELKNE